MEVINMAYAINTLYNPAETFSNDLNFSLKLESSHLGAELLSIKNNMQNYAITYDNQRSGYFINANFNKKDKNVTLELHKNKHLLSKIINSFDETTKSLYSSLATIINSDISLNNIIAHSEPVRVKDKEMQVAIDQLKIESEKANKTQEKYKNKDKNKSVIFKDIDINGVNDIYEKEFMPEEDVQEKYEENER